MKVFKTLKHHLQGLSILVILAMIYIIVKTITFTIISLTLPLDQMVKFTDVIKSEYFTNGLDQPNIWIAKIFGLILLGTNIYLLRILFLSYKVIKDYKIGNLLTFENADRLRTVGQGFLNYGLLYATIFIGFGLFFYNDLSVIPQAITALIISFILGKIILVFAFISAKGGLLQQENDLTI